MYCYHQLINETVKAQVEDVYRPFQKLWLTISMCEICSFQLSVAFGLLYMDQLKRTVNSSMEDIPECIEYRSKAINSLNSSLSNGIHEIGEGIIGTILGLVCASV
jgi:hypothetical protein